jgi:hypothetical protein
MNTCTQCNCKIIKPFNSIFCSRSCSTINHNLSRPKRSNDSRLKTSHTLKSKYASGELIPNLPPNSKKISEYPFTRLYGLYNCHHCSISFWQVRYNQKCCSIECRDNIRSQNKCRKTHITFFSKYDNKLIDLQSTWELSIAEWLDSVNIIWSRPSKRIKWYYPETNQYKTYLPDFYLVDYNQYLDVKNPIKMMQDHAKLEHIKSIIPLMVGDINCTKAFVAGLAGIEPTPLVSKTSMISISLKAQTTFNMGTKT